MWSSGSGSSPSAENDRLRSKVGFAGGGPAEEVGSAPLCLHPTGSRETLSAPSSAPNHPAFLSRTSIMEIICFEFLLLRKR